MDFNFAYYYHISKSYIVREYNELKNHSKQKINQLIIFFLKKYSSLYSDYQDLQKELEEIKEKFTFLQKEHTYQIQCLQNKIENYILQIKELQTQIAEYKKLIADNIRNVKKLLEKNSNLKSELEEKNQQILVLKEELNKNKVEIESLKKKLIYYENRNKRIKNKFLRLFD
ncbi:hypothetical protein [Caminibacter pacificus]